MQEERNTPTLRFDFPDAQGAIRSLRFTDPVQVFTAHKIDEVQSVLEAAQQAADNGLYAAGYIAYEAAPAFDTALRVRSGASLPLAWFGCYTRPLPVPAALPDIPVGQASVPANLRGHGGPRHLSSLARQEDTFTLSGWQSPVSRDAYLQAVNAIREAAASGETYQANYTFPLRAQFQGELLALYHRLRRAQQAAYSAYLDLGPFHILSLSPELFFHKVGGQITTRPMKGTVARGRSSAEDRERAAWLAASEKNRAENLMIVDLLRNDLGRLADIGSVQFPQLFTLERYPTVWQMTSTVTATLPPTTSLLALMRALFPCGSVTGAPKVRTMQILSELETMPRQVYCGAIGYLTPTGEAQFNVAIRTLWIDRETGQAEYGVGGGITFDSIPEAEYAEAWAKAAVLTEEMPTFDLLETMRLEDGQYILRERHLRRLQDSADYFGIPLRLEDVEERLDAEARQWETGCRRVRLLVSQEGNVRLETQPLTELPASPQPVALARTPVHSQDRFLFHKTTHRAVYESHAAEYPGVFDVLLWNERGELTEFTLGNLVVELDGKRWTPPLDCGLLPGTLRAELLESGQIAERRLTRADLELASALWRINSVRGWTPVTLVP